MPSDGAMVRARAVEQRSPHNRVFAVVLCWFLGVFGVHRFYVGKIGTGILMLLTGGGFGIWWLIDFFVLLTGRFKDAEGRVLGPPQIEYAPLPEPQAPPKQLPSFEPELEPVQGDAGDWDDEVMRDPLEDKFDELERELGNK